MQNAHLRLVRLEYVRHTEGTNTHVWLHVDRYVGEGEQAHLLSVLGGESEVGAVRAAIYERHSFTITFLDARRVLPSRASWSAVYAIFL